MEEMTTNCIVKFLLDFVKGLFNTLIDAPRTAFIDQMGECDQNGEGDGPDLDNVVWNERYERNPGGRLW